MRKSEKNSILEIIQTMFVAHANIKNFIEKKENEKVLFLLEECQNTAIEIGTIIEKSEGEGLICVSYLEAYCEDVYKMAQELPQNVSSIKVRKILDKKLIQIENSIKNDIIVKVEMVFCPYKASMWDSLESIWKAADEDENCEAYVVPIPFYDRNKDLSFGQMHYEGEEFPDYVPITHYENYDFEKRHPDVVFIHNPYDDENYVTSVDPKFYSYNLREYTDKLVYVPYFVLAEVDPDNRKEVEKISHFIVTSGVANSDVVIVQSEAMRRAYINELLAQFDEDELDEEIIEIIENKIWGLGSPKFDKVYNLDKKDYPLPSEWQKLVENKKVVLFNNSIPQILVHKEEFLDKLERVLDYFKTRWDYVLWWRPHPLIESTIQSMRPELFERYSQIVKKYREENYGVYDDTADLYRAMAWGDRYYGAKSSVVYLFGMTGKPVLLFAKNVRERVRYEINNWYTSDIGENDLSNWLDGKEDWKLLKTVQEAFSLSSVEGKIGEEIYRRCI